VAFHILPIKLTLNLFLLLRILVLFLPFPSLRIKMMCIKPLLICNIALHTAFSPHGGGKGRALYINQTDWDFLEWLKVRLCRWIQKTLWHVGLNIVIASPSFPSLKHLIGKSSVTLRSSAKRELEKFYQSVIWRYSVSLFSHVWFESWIENRSPWSSWLFCSSSELKAIVF
jgi:hypothetical protein